MDDKRPLDEEFDTQLDVQRDPCGAWMAIQSMAEEIRALRSERERLALAICGGEDAPGYANSRCVEELEKVARQNRQSHMADINRLMRAEAERDRLREALRFYAEGNWHGDYPGGVSYCGPTDAADFPTHLDYGNRARAALASTEGGE